MNTTTKKLYLSCVKLSADDVKFGIDFLGLDIVEMIFAESYGVKGNFEIRPSSLHENFDLYVTGSDLFKMNALRKVGVFSNDPENGFAFKIAGFISELKQENPDAFYGLLGRVNRFETADALVGAGIVSHKEVMAKTRFTKRDFDRNSIFEMHAAKAERHHLSLVM